MNLAKITSYRPGPGMLVSAAFIGPGTVATASLAGANFGYALLWALVFATIATIILQSFVTRITIVSGQTLGSAILSSFSTKPAKIAVILLLFSALLIGNAAYEAGNIGGAALGLKELLPSSLASNSSSLFSETNLIAFFLIILLLVGEIERITQFLIALVVIMSISFLIIFFITKPNISALFAGLIPTIPNDAIFTAIALIGTTIVPYNLFLHASNVHKKWSHIDQLDIAKTESAISIGIGGLVSIAILASAANIFFTNNISIDNLGEIAIQIEPLFGNLASMALAIGLLAAGLTSAMTAPLATSYIVTEIWKSENKKLQEIRFKSIAIAIVLVGATVNIFNINTIQIIFFAQVANGILLPFVAVFLVKLSMNKKIMGEYVNNKVQNMAAFAILIISIALGLRTILRAFEIMP